MAEDFLTREQYAARFGCSLKTVQRAIRRGDLPTITVGKRVRIIVGAIEDEIDEAIAAYDERRSKS